MVKPALIGRGTNTLADLNFVFPVRLVLYFWTRFVVLLEHLLNYWLVVANIRIKNIVTKFWVKHC